jgi:hypothetical protein
MGEPTIDVATLSPFFLGVPDAQRTELQRLEVELTGTADYFSLPFDFAARFKRLRSGAAAAAAAGRRGAGPGHRGVLAIRRRPGQGWDACGLPTVNGGEHDLAVPRRAGDGPRVAGEEAPDPSGTTI